MVQKNPDRLWILPGLVSARPDLDQHFPVLASRKIVDA